MKRFLLIALVFTATNAFPGVGGSTGGSSNRMDRGLNFYIKSRQYDPKIPYINFESEDSLTTLPITEVCQRDADLLESKFEIKVSHFDENGNLIAENMEKVSRTRKNIKTKILKHLFREDEVFKVEELIPVDYEIEVYSTHSTKDRDPRIVKRLNYTLESCQ